MERRKILGENDNHNGMSLRMSNKGGHYDANAEWTWADSSAWSRSANGSRQVLSGFPSLFGANGLRSVIPFYMSIFAQFENTMCFGGGGRKDPKTPPFLHKD